MKTFSYIWSDKLKAAIEDAWLKPYSMSLVGEDKAACIAAVNQGIDAYLQACFIPERGDSYRDTGYRLECVVSPESLPVLVRRLMESGDETGLASGICQTLEIELI
jgi:hypothetical protein